MELRFETTFTLALMDSFRVAQKKAFYAALYSGKWGTDQLKDFIGMYQMGGEL